MVDEDSASLFAVIFNDRSRVNNEMAGTARDHEEIVLELPLVDELLLSILNKCHLKRMVLNFRPNPAEDIEEGIQDLVSILRSAGAWQMRKES